MFRRIRPDWQYTWHEIDRVVVKGLRRRLNPQMSSLQIYSADEVRKFSPFYWRVLPIKKIVFNRGAFRNLRGWSEQAFSDEILKYPLAKLLKARLAEKFSFNFRNKGVVSGGFALETSRHAIGIMILVFALIGYSVADYLFYPEAYAESPWKLFPAFFGAALVVLVAAYYYLKDKGIPLAETIGLTCLLGCVAGLAMPMFALRINALTDERGLYLHYYQVVIKSDEVLLMPNSNELPVIDHFSYGAYWEQLGDGFKYGVMVRKGGLGFVQFDQGPIRDDMSSYYHGD